MANIYKSTNFIRSVHNNLILIQNKDATQITEQIDYTKVRSSLVNNNFLMIFFETTYKTDPIILEFLSNDDAIKALNIFNGRVNELRNNAYNTPNIIANETLYDPNTFIKNIRFNDYSVQIVNIGGKITNRIVAEQVTGVFVSGNFVKVKTEATDTVISLAFIDYNHALLGAEKLRIAIKTITDKIVKPKPGGKMRTFTADFEDKNVWFLNPKEIFALSAFSLEYFEIVCASPSLATATISLACGTCSDTASYVYMGATGGTCSENNEVYRACKGLVEYDGDINTDTLKSVTISFNQSITGRATLIGK